MLSTNANYEIMDRQMKEGAEKLTYPSFHTKKYALICKWWRHDQSSNDNKRPLS
jgi:hypothetical protein